MCATERNTDENRMSIGEHLDELRRRIIYALVGVALAMTAGLLLTPRTIAFLKAPYMEQMEAIGQEPNLVVLQVTGGLVNYLRVGFYSAIVIASPWVCYQLWMFVAAGLHGKEKRYVRRIIPFCALLFLSGAAFFVLLIADQVLHYLLKMCLWVGTIPMITFENYISFMLRMIVVFGVAFQTPLVILVLAWVGLVSIRSLNQHRRHAIVAILVMAAIFTPPDLFSQVALAVPMWLLYELGVLLAYLAIRGKARARK